MFVISEYQPEIRSGLVRGKMLLFRGYGKVNNITLKIHKYYTIS